VALRRQPVLHPLSAVNLQRGDAPAQCREIGVGCGFELPSQPAQRRDRGTRDRGNRRLGAGQLAGSETAASARSEPKSEEDQIDVACRAVLDRDQRVGDPGPGIERQREPPEGLAGRVVFTAPDAALSTPDETRAIRAIWNQRRCLRGPRFHHARTHAPWRWISTSKP